MLGAQLYSQQPGTEKPHEKVLRLLNGKLHTENKINSNPAPCTGKIKEGTERTDSFLLEKGFF